LKTCQTAKELWDKLETIYKAKSNATRLQLKNELGSLSLQPTESVTSYVGRARSIKDELAASGHPVQEEDVVLSVLGGLTKDYDTVVTIMETSEDTLDLDNVLSKLLQVEQKIFKKTESCSSRALFSKGNAFNGQERPAGNSSGQKSGKICYYCNKPGHFKRECRQKARDEQRGSNGYNGSKGNHFSGGAGTGSGNSDKPPQRSSCSVAFTARDRGRHSATAGHWTRGHLSTTPATSG
jgi:hypothetical protein